MEEKDYTSYVLNNAEIFTLFNQGLFNHRMAFLSPIYKLFAKFNENDNASLMANPTVDNIARSIKERMEIFTYMDKTVKEIGEEVSKIVPDFFNLEFNKALQVHLKPEEGESLEDYQKGLLKLLKRVVYEYPKEIAEAGNKYGFQFDNGKYEVISDTDSFILYKVLPTKQNVTIKENCQPMLFIHPYVLGHNVLGFFPNLDRSYIHAFANAGVPTYLRYRKKANQSATVLSTTLDEDILATKTFCKLLSDMYKKPVVLNGYCHGGWLSLVALLSGELDNLVDTLITSVAPLDAAQAEIYHPTVNMVKNLETDIFKLADLKDNRRYIDGEIVSLFVKLPTSGKENGIYTFFDALKQFKKLIDKPISVEMAGMQHWLLHERVPMSVDMMQSILDAYITPIAEDGTFPAKPFGKKINIKRIDEKKIKFYICYAEKDYIVPPSTNKTIKKWVKVEEVAFPKGHAAIATSWSKPGSECFVGNEFEGKRGPLKYYLDLQKEKGYEV